MSKHRTNKEKKARRAAKAAALPAIVEQRQQRPADLYGVTLPVNVRDYRTEAHNLAFPDDAREVPFAVAPANLAPGSLEVLAEQMRLPAKKRDISMRDSIILENCNRFVPYDQVGAMPTVNMSPTEVKSRYLELLADENTYTQAEMRLVITGRLKAMINMVYNLAQQGSTEHLKIMATSLEQMQKMYDLWSNKVTEEQKVINAEQTRAIINLAREMANGFREIMLELKNPVEPQVIDAVISRALDTGAQRIEAEMNKTIKV